MTVLSWFGVFCRADIWVDFTPLQAALTVLTLPSLPRGLYVKSVQFAGQDITHAPLDTKLGTNGTLQIVLSAKAAAVTANVQ